MLQATTDTFRETAVHTRLGLVSTFPPTRCGIGRFSRSLVGSLLRVAPWMASEVVRLVDGPSPIVDRAHEAPTLDPDSSVSIRSAASFLNGCDVVSLQHEFGIYGSRDGASIVDLLSRIERPTVTTLHTVLPEPSPNQRWIINEIAQRSELVVLCDTAGETLVRNYGISPTDLSMIRHGCAWTVSPPNPRPRRNLITWGLLGPGKGLERAIRSVHLLRRWGVSVDYRIVGRVHPEVVRRNGSAYRRSLEALVSELGLGDNVDFVDRYVEDDVLGRMVQQSDVVVVPYDNKDQASSGVVTEALGIGRPVVATRFPYAIEMLGTGAGLVVDHDSHQMAKAIRDLLGDDDLYEATARASAEWSGILQWDAVAERYVRVLDRLSAHLATA